MHEDKREEALEHAMRCRRLVPDLAPSEAAHPANVVGVLAEADDLLRRMRTGKLTVTSQPDKVLGVPQRAPFPAPRPSCWIALRRASTACR